MLLLRVKFSKLDALHLEHAPFAVAGRKVDDHYLIPFDHPDYATLRKSLAVAEKGIPYFHRKWAEFHEWTKTGALEDPWKFLTPFFADLPNGDCQCQTHAFDIAKSMEWPMDRQGRIKAGVLFHDRVNQRSPGPHHIPLADAMMMYGQ